MEYIKETYGLPFLKKGLKVIFQDQTGKITRTHAGYICVKFENGQTECLHPTWEIAYFDKNDVLLKDFRTTND